MIKILFNISTEPQIFKSKFYGWDDVIAVDFTRTAQSVARTGPDLKVMLDCGFFFEFCLRSYANCEWWLFM